MLLGTCSGISDDNLFRARRQPTQVDQIMSLPAHALGPSKPSAFGNHKAARAAFRCADYKYGNDRRQASRYQARPFPKSGTPIPERWDAGIGKRDGSRSHFDSSNDCTAKDRSMHSSMEEKSSSLAGQVSVVTGAGRGIGAAIARMLASPGALMAPWTKPHKPFARLAAVPRYCRVMLPTWVPYSRSLPRWRRPSAGWISWSTTPALAASAVRFTNCRPRLGTRF